MLDYFNKSIALPCLAMVLKNKIDEEKSILFDNFLLIVDVEGPFSVSYDTFPFLLT